LSSANWLFSRRFDLLVFGGPAIIALILVAFGPWLAPSGDLPLPMWIFAILIVDVAHVWSTIYRTYLDKAEFNRRASLYIVVPLSCYVIGFIIYSISATLFWTLLAYVAVFHFIRQQYGWVALYNRRAGDVAAFDRYLDRLSIYISTCFPILWWHAHLPRKFSWFMPGDFISGLSPVIVKIMWPIYLGTLFTYIFRQVQRWRRERIIRWGKNLVVCTTATCWFVGIVATNTDWAFSVTNVLIHGIPYFAIIWVYGRKAEYPKGSLLEGIFTKRRIFAFFALVIGLAFIEEWAWDRLIWHENSVIFPFGEVMLSNAMHALVVPLLALPQATHYVLDAWIWKTHRTQNPQLASTMALSSTIES